MCYKIFQLLSPIPFYPTWLPGAKMWMLPPSKGTADIQHILPKFSVSEYTAESSIGKIISPSFVDTVPVIENEKTRVVRDPNRQ